MFLNVLPENFDCLLLLMSVFVRNPKPPPILRTELIDRHDFENAFYTWGTKPSLCAFSLVKKTLIVTYILFEESFRVFIGRITLATKCAAPSSSCEMSSGPTLKNF